MLFRSQHDPSEAQRFIERYEAKREPLIIGARDYKKIPLRRRIPNTFSRVVLSAIAGEYLEDNQCGYRLLDRRMIEAFLETNEAGYNFAIEMIIVCRERGWEIGWVPICPPRRAARRPTRTPPPPGSPVPLAVASRYQPPPGSPGWPGSACGADGSPDGAGSACSAAWYLIQINLVQCLVRGDFQSTH